ncbi:hypothetical protein [Paraburkholderia sp.]|uniref:hypothetical protein n=1 Tax=Paraburkholderia sp. TaxID=1926495 RepID=UPI00238FD6FC|nr:hypothetical protein [Paraburkholderia sp.]MDE1181805.1 hypothetical protein [Paraburkholderia sp.]
MSDATPDQIARMVRINPIMILSGSGDAARALRYRGKHTITAVLGVVARHRECRALVYCDSVNAQKLWVDVQTGAFCTLQ